jgi:biotin carboxyl carrier protein
MKKIFLIIPIILILSIAVYFLFFNKTDDTGEDKNLFSNIVNELKKDDGETLYIKNLPIDIQKYDKTTQRAGDMKFSNMKLQFDVMYYDYGFVVPENEMGPKKQNPQPTFIAPLGTKVKSIVDGVVVNIPKLYSNDYSIMIAKNKESNMVYELEHVINTKVKVGDTVKAGDIVAEVSDYDSRNTPGYGLVEIGILVGGNPPHHVCPFNYLDSENKEEIYSTLKQFYSDWNDFKGKEIYNISDYKTVGCLTEDKIDG